ncbi:hypothetical protein BD626DRAFT_584461 [Schizophyllum amplum]|uniref:TFG box profile domain-containing protein n=1 Tax=Schizophyllum amplum TaxID=97359 RepID=A0A550C9D8_9AGAR|nr:hypothetical protein BD626DRAFT_584461 [Auriculariopsis ampla]
MPKDTATSKMTRTASSVLHGIRKVAKLRYKNLKITSTFGKDALKQRVRDLCDTLDDLDVSQKRASEHDAAGISAEAFSTAELSEALPTIEATVKSVDTAALEPAKDDETITDPDLVAVKPLSLPPPVVKDIHTYQESTKSSPTSICLPSIASVLSCPASPSDFEAAELQAPHTLPSFGELTEGLHANEEDNDDHLALPLSVHNHPMGATAVSSPIHDETLPSFEGIEAPIEDALLTMGLNDGPQRPDRRAQRRVRRAADTDTFGVLPSSILATQQKAVKESFDAFVDAGGAVRNRAPRTVRNRGGPNYKRARPSKRRDFFDVVLNDSNDSEPISSPVVATYSESSSALGDLARYKLKRALPPLPSGSYVPEYSFETHPSWMRILTAAHLDNPHSPLYAMAYENSEDSDDSMDCSD